MKDLLEICDRTELLEEIRPTVDGSQRNDGTMFVREKLFNEAYSLALDGDIEGAKHRLNLWLNPKWSSYGECQAQYDLAMSNKREANKRGASL